MELKIESRNVEMRDSWEADVRARIDGIRRLHPEMTHARVILTRNTHHQKGADVSEVLALVTLPRRHTITARKEGGSFEDAIRAAFDALEVELKRFRDRRGEFAPRRGEPGPEELP
jgi:ribosome-associated translation inhibitor RaiA